MKTYQYDLIVLDWQLPDISGIEVLQKYRLSGGKSPVLFLTGKNAVNEKEMGLDAGADDYLTKPFHLKELSARLRALLRRPAQMIGSTIKAHDLTLDCAQHKVYKNDKEIHLAPMEFALLEFFMRHPNQIFHTEALLERVWTADSERSAETLRTCVKNCAIKLMRRLSHRL